MFLGVLKHDSFFEILITFQNELYKILHNILVNSESRDAALSFIATALEKNSKKSQIQVGFVSFLTMLIYMYVDQRC